MTFSGAHHSVAHREAIISSVGKSVHPRPPTSSGPLGGLCSLPAFSPFLLLAYKFGSPVLKHPSLDPGPSHKSDQDTLPVKVFNS